MLFKLFTLFSMFALCTSTSESERQRQCSSVSKYGGSGYGDGSGSGYGMGILGQTVTVTVTETVTVTPTGDVSTESPTETSTDTSTETSTSSTSGDSKDLNSQKHCLYLFNKLRKSQNLPLFKSATQAEIDCADKAAAYDAQAGYHSSFYASVCQGASAQCECQKNSGFDLPTADPNDPLKTCINAYIAEHTLGAYPQENQGQWRIITGDFKYVACGTDGNGFYTHNFYN